MILNFLGRGASFNPKEGNTSAFFIENKQLFLIDCGENIFERLINKNILEDIENINVIITHTHADHIGSLETLILYSFYKIHKPINIVLPKNKKYISNIKTILKCFGCKKNMYNCINEKKFDNKYQSFKSIRYIKTQHCKELVCFSILFNTKNGIIYYSGDTNEISIIKKLIATEQLIDKIYIDTTTDDYPGNVHLNIDILKKEIPEKLKNRVYCMHLNNENCIEKAKKIGFNIVEIFNK